MSAPPNIASLGPAGHSEPSGSLGAYTILTKLASGGMATVFAGTKLGMAGFERLVAIKCCHPHLSRDPDFISMFLDEARLAARIHHPNVVATLDVGSEDFLYLVMEYLEGDSFAGILRRAMERRSTVPLEVSVRVLIDALAGLHAAHELCGGDGQMLNLVHRDVSPQNILVGADGISRITDFGIAFAAARSTNTQDGRLKGKFSYMAPEQVRGEETTRRIDIFAAGIVLWEALTGRLLFRRKDDVATINAVLSAQVPPPSSLVPGVPTSLDQIVLKALQREPAERFATAAEFANALECLNLEGITHRSVASHVDRTIGPALAERRDLIRTASELAQQGVALEPLDSDVHPRFARGANGEAVDVQLEEVLPRPSPDDLVATRVVGAPIVAFGDDEIVAPGDIEHRRMRGLLAAAMLLLVGGAVGLLLARSNAGVARPPVSAPAPNVAGPGGVH